jgi:hypothetical protein
MPTLSVNQIVSPVGAVFVKVRSWKEQDKVEEKGVVVRTPR